MEKITIHESSSNYSPVEAALLQQAYNELEVKAQKGELSIEETRIRVAYLRYQREGDFKIAVRAATNKKPKEPKEPKERKPRTTRTRKSKKDVLLDDIAKASQLLFKKNNGQELTEEEETFLQLMTENPPAP